MSSTASSNAPKPADIVRDTPGILHSSEVPKLVRRYVHQLINGCGNSECTEVLCWTGIQNTSRGKPVRKYTTRSARTIAISMCATPSPKAHLCSHLTEDSIQGKDAVPEPQGLSDPSALDQQLSETQSFKLLTQPDTTCTHDHELALQNAQITGLLEAAGRDPSLPSEGFLSNAELVQGILPCFEWILSKLPLHRPASFHAVNAIVSKGYAYPPRNESLPTDERFNNWLPMLDVLDHRPYLRILGQVVKVIATRHTMDMAFQQSCTNVGVAPPPRARNSQIVNLFIQQLFHRDVTSIKLLSLVLWLKRLCAEHWNGQPMVKFGSVCMGAWVILTQLTAVPSQPNRKDPDAARAVYHMPMISLRLSTHDLAQSYYERFARGPRTDARHILTFQALFSMKELNLYFRMLNHLEMRAAHSDVEKSINLLRRYQSYADEVRMSEQSKHATKHYLLLNVSRGKILQDTFDQLWQRRKDELKRPLRVRLGEVDEHEIGHDLGGVQIEFFNLVCKEMFSEEAQMFVTNPDSGTSYFKPGSLQPLYMFELFGLLFALALYNGITLPITLPWAFYRHLLRHTEPSTPQQCLDGMRDDWPTLTRSLESLLNDPDAPSVENTFPFECNNVRMEVMFPNTTKLTDGKALLPVVNTSPPVNVLDIAEELPGWVALKPPNQPIEVPRENMGTYVRAYAFYTTWASVFPQWQAFRKGFAGHGIVDARFLQLFEPAHLKAVIEGSSHLSVNDLRSIAQYDGWKPDDIYISMFWRVVSSWPQAKLKLLLKFVTAAERVPITGGLVFLIKRYETDDLERLPTSSTCFGTLMLPVYRSQRVLAQKLDLALKYGAEGFGTG